jgi:hypothetical protein
MGKPGTVAATGAAVGKKAAFKEHLVYNLFCWSVIHNVTISMRMIIRQLRLNAGLTSTCVATFFFMFMVSGFLTYGQTNTNIISQASTNAVQVVTNNPIISASPQDLLNAISPLIAIFVTSLVSKYWSQVPKMAVPLIAVAFGTGASYLSTLATHSGQSFGKSLLFGLATVTIREIMAQTTDHVVAMKIGKPVPRMGKPAQKITADVRPTPESPSRPPVDPELLKILESSGGPEKPPTATRPQT